ncbi:MAG: S-adenosylmethionine:tRNA ribosyltransferase-isomerase [Chitinophagales bacterium]
MNKPGQLAIADFTYHLPESQIALFPAQPRDASKLLVWNKGTLTETIYRNLPDFLPQQTLLVFNNTRVVCSRLLFRRPTGAQIEIFCLEPASRYADITQGMQQQQEVYWKCLVGKSSKWKEKELHLPFGNDVLTASIHSKENDAFIIHFSWTGSLTFSEVLAAAGAVPLPPYIKRSAQASDRETYQTIYGKEEGSVAAPTAGLHFTPEIFHALKQKNIDTDFVTLHVGAGTFKPVKSEVIADHEMHAEWLEVPVTLIESLLQHIQANLPVAAVGTTAARTLESLYWTGIKILNGEPIVPNELLVSQWEPYEKNSPQSTADALKALLHFLRNKKLDRLIGKTQILIAPGYTFRIVNLLATNFHQPQSTLLLLIAAFMGSSWRELYAYALENNFRFLSYGDGCLLIPE